MTNLAWIFDGLVFLTDLLFKTRDRLKQSGEWNEAQEAEFNKRLEATRTAKHWQPHSEK